MGRRSNLLWPSVIVSRRPGLSPRSPPKRCSTSVCTDGDGEVSTPHSITERTARVAVAELEANLGTVERLQDALEDDALWEELCERYPCR
jgi:hypothetical protein